MIQIFQTLLKSSKTFPFQIPEERSNIINILIYLIDVID